MIDQDVDDISRAVIPPNNSRPKRKIVTQSSQEYIKRILTHAELAYGQSLYPGQNYSGLAKYFSEAWNAGPASLSTGETQDHGSFNFACMHDLNLPEGAADRIVQFNNVQEFERVCEQKKQQSSPSILLFLSGKGSPAWLSTIGWKCDVDPEFWLRHLNVHLQHNDNPFFTQPALPSSSRNIVRLKIPTIGHREHDEVYSQKKLDSLRKITQDEMQDYNMQLRQGGHTDTGTSIVRSFALHDLNHFSLEQEISLCVNNFGGGWIAIIWLDSGNDLSNGPLGPWRSERLRTYSWKTIITPTIMHRPDIALLTQFIKREGNMPSPFSKQYQYCSLLPAHYGRFLHQEASRKDPLYALSELFTFVATAESQFLNMIEQQISLETARLLKGDGGAFPREELNTAAIANLLYNKQIIEKHIGSLRDNIGLLQKKGGHKWPHCTEEKQAKRIQNGIELVLDDFQYLLMRAEQLSVSCDRGMDFAGNNAIVEESKRALDQATYISRLTLLAFLYIPASFSTSAFGMNLKQLGQGNNPILIWIWVGTLFGCYAVTYLVWHLDLLVLSKKWYERCSMIAWKYLRGNPVTY